MGVMKQTGKKAMIKFILLLTVVLSLVFALSACGSSDPLLGTWSEPNSGVVMELNKDGEVSITYNSATIKLTYTTEDPDVLIIQASADGSIPEQRMTYKVNEDKLVLTLDGVKTNFFRVK